MIHVERRKSAETEREQLIEQLRQSLEREAHFSRLLQRALLPEKPSVGPGYDIGYVYIPAYAGREIGGDFYDVFRTKDGKIGIVVGDVAGKGVEATSLAAATRNTVRAFAYESSSPAESLARTNDVLMGQEQLPESLVTVLLIILDGSTGRFQFSSAGHPAPALWWTDDSVRFLKGSNLPLGVFVKQEFDDTTGQLNPGGKIVIYTDGLSEARHNSEMFGPEGIERILREYGHLSPREIVERLVETACEWAGGSFQDDTVILVLDRTTGSPIA